MFKTLFKLSVGAFAVIGLLVCLVLTSGLWYAKSHISPPPKPPEKIVLVLNFKQELGEKYDGDLPHSLRSAFDFFVDHDEDGRPVLHDVVQALLRGSADPRVVGVVGLFGYNLPHLAQSQEIRTALEKFRASGKFSYAFATGYGEFGPGNNAYYMASGFEKIWLQPVGTLGLAGMRMENPFGRGVLDKIGVKATFVQREEYKSALSFATEDKMPAPMREEMQTILDDLSSQVVGGIATSRQFTPEQVKELMAKGPYTAKEALERKLIDQIGYLDEIEKTIDDQHGKKAAKLSAASYLAVPDAADKVAEKPKATIALIVAQGEIGEHGGRPSPMSGGAGMDTRQIVNAFEEAAEDKEVQQILFRVDSPGGSPTASETIRRAMMQAQAKGKKVVVSMGQMAGSGGYWIAMNADRIFADPATLTGSIGVLGGKLDLSGLYEKIGLNWETLQVGTDVAGLWSTTHGYTPEERARMDVLMDDTYNTFRENVAKARKIPLEKMPSVSKGRVFTGAQAVKLGLVDELGGMRAALDYIKTAQGLKPEDRIMLEPFPPPESTADRVRDMLKGFFGQGASLPALNFATMQQWLRTAMPPIMVRMPLLQVQ